MKSNLLSEMQQILDHEEMMNVALPIPTYLYVQRYGRDIEEEMPEISRALGQKEWFPFSTNNQQKEGNLLRHFKMELERHSGLGKEYAGSVLIELSGEEDTKELEEILDYIESQKQRLHCVYTTKMLESVPEMRRQLENHGFVRVVQGEKYDAYEQIEIFQNTLETYHFELEEEARHYITEFFRIKEWQEHEAVKIRIQNLAKEMVYSKLLGGEERKTVVTKEEVEQVLASLQEEPVKKRQIGFVLGGAA